MVFFRLYPPFGGPTTHGIFPRDFHGKFQVSVSVDSSSTVTWVSRCDRPEALCNAFAGRSCPRTGGFFFAVKKSGVCGREPNQWNKQNMYIYILYNILSVIENWTNMNQLQQSDSIHKFLHQLIEVKHPDEWQGFCLFELLQLVQDFAHQTVYQCINDSNKWLCAKCTISKHLPAIVWQ